MRNFIPLQLARYLYDGCSMQLKNKLQVSQNSALMAVKRCLGDHPTQPLHDELEVDYLAVCRQKSSLKMVFRGLMNAGPPELNNIFTYCFHTF